MIEIRDRACFLGEPLQSALVFRDFRRQNLERDRPAKFRRVLRQIHLTHAARADL